MDRNVYFFGPATDTQYTYEGNGVCYHNHGWADREGYRVSMELCGHPVATAYAVVDDFGDLVPVRAAIDYLMQEA